MSAANRPAQPRSNKPRLPKPTLVFAKTAEDLRPSRLAPGRWVRIDRGAYVDVDPLPADLEAWEAARLVATARLQAVAHRFRLRSPQTSPSRTDTSRASSSGVRPAQAEQFSASPASSNPKARKALVSFTAASALVAADLSTWDPNPPVTFRSTRTPHLQSPLPSVLLQGHMIPGVKVVQTASASSNWIRSTQHERSQRTNRPHVTLVQNPWQVTVGDLAALQHPLPAFVDACGGRAGRTEIFPSSTAISWSPAAMKKPSLAVPSATFWSTFRRRISG